jgi:hypothetical protein
MSETTDREPEEYGRTDLKGLLAFLDLLIKENIRLTEVTYVVNWWKLYGFIPLKHHGFVLSCSHHGFLSLDFGSRGILWDVDEVFPELPDNTFSAKNYRIDVDPMNLKLYCQRTKPFDWFTNECSTWAAGLLKVLCVHDSKGRKKCESTADLLEQTNARRNSTGSIGSAIEVVEIPYDLQEPGPDCGLIGAPTCFGGQVPRHRFHSVEDDDRVDSFQQVTVEAIRA